MIDDKTKPNKEKTKPSNSGMFSNPKGPGGLIIFFISHSFLLLLIHSPITAAASIKSNCTGNAYVNGGSFQTDLQTLFTSLITNSSSANSANATSGAAYGLYLCQGDLAHADCLACIQNATSDITDQCPSTRQAIIWYDNCMLRYSDTDFFGVPDTDGFNMTNPKENTNSPVPFKTVTSLAQEAPFRQPLMFASKASAADQVYAMAQCTVDLSSHGCSECLTTILADIKACCTGSKGWRYLAHSCWIRYEATPFLKDTNSTYTEIIEEQCSNDSFPQASLGAMKASLNGLLSNVTTKARATGFYNTTAGEGSTRLYGLALCRADLTTPGHDCNSCLNETVSTITENCPNKTQDIVWYEKCHLRYSNQNFFGIVDNGGRTWCGVKQVTSAANNATMALATKLVGMAANNPLMFAADELRISDSLSSYVMMQCTRDLSRGGCNDCLKNGMSMIIKNHCPQTNGWRYWSGSCTIRYEDFPFFNTSVIQSSGSLAPRPSSPGIEGNRKKKKRSHVAEIVAPIVGVILLGPPLLYYLWGRSKRRHDRKQYQQQALTSKDLPFMDLAIIQAATSNFSDANKLGEGGFGPVYKGTLRGGREIAVKRLSTKSKQGATEFKNEVKLIAKLQHKNLVRMLGFCVEREEKLLVYEYLPNKSLDTILFDPNKCSQLHWRLRQNIVAGIARGLLYLHEDSLLKVIHRDLKAGNVLLDNELNPKISDFGMAKIYEANESESITNRVVGTYGYMAPEYALDGIFSVKSDVYSFGVLLLEILSGQKNGRSHYEQHGQTLLQRAWQLWTENKAMELMDPLLGSSYLTNEATKLSHIGLLCVQENAEERPTMSLVVHMLQSEEMVMRQPTQPPTFIRRQKSRKTTDMSSSSQKTHSTVPRSINDITITDLTPR